MKIQNSCVDCIINQSVKVADAIEADRTLREVLIGHVRNKSKDFSFSKTPPEIAAYIYSDMAKIAHKEDLYAKQKELATQKARSFIPMLEEKLASSDEKLLQATKIAVAGNVIDLAAEVAYDLHEELEKIFDTPFAHDDFDAMQQQLSQASKVVVLGDNVGEHIFDYLFIQTLQNLYPTLDIYYFVRGKPIINDVTLQEAKDAGFDCLCHLIDSGVDTPGFAYHKATKEAQELFDCADLVISKGMGNYECLSPAHRSNICFLLKVKCNVVATFLGRELGDIVCKLV